MATFCNSLTAQGTVPAHVRGPLDQHAQRGTRQGSRGTQRAYRTLSRRHPAAAAASFSGGSSSSSGDALPEGLDKERSFYVNDDEENPDFDSVVLDEKYYAEMGLSAEELADQILFAPEDADPEGQAVRLEDLAERREGAPQFLMDQLDAQEVYGPEAVVLAGFRAEEVVMVRVILDSAGGQAVKVLPATAAALTQPLAAALQAPEPAWEQPRPAEWGQGGGWGAQRTLLVSGLKVAAVAAVVELLEESGLPALCCAIAEEGDAALPLGQVLARTVQEQRGRKNPKQQIWEASSHVADKLPDIEALIGDAARQRMQQMSKDLEEGNLEALAAGSEDVILPALDLATLTDTSTLEPPPDTTLLPQSTPPAPSQPSASLDSRSPLSLSQEAVPLLAQEDLDRLSAAAAAMRVQCTYSQPAGPAPPPVVTDAQQWGTAEQQSGVTAPMTDQELFYTKFMFEAMQIRREAEAEAAKASVLPLSPVDAQILADATAYFGVSTKEGVRPPSAQEQDLLRQVASQSKLSSGQQMDLIDRIASGQTVPSTAVPLPPQAAPQSNIAQRQQPISHSAALSAIPSYSRQQHQQQQQFGKAAAGAGPGSAQVRQEPSPAARQERQAPSTAEQGLKDLPEVIKVEGGLISRGEIEAALAKGLSPQALRSLLGQAGQPSAPASQPPPPASPCPPPSASPLGTQPPRPVGTPQPAASKPQSPSRAAERPASAGPGARTSPWSFKKGMSPWQQGSPLQRGANGRKED